MKLIGNYGPDDPLGFEGSEWQLARYKNCAYYSQRTVNPQVARMAGNGTGKVIQERPGTVVVDMSDPTNPKFATNHTFYVYFTDKTGDIRIEEGRRSSGDPDRAAASLRNLLTIAHREFPNHEGGQLQFAGFRWHGTC